MDLWADLAMLLTALAVVLSIIAWTVLAQGFAVRLRWWRRYEAWLYWLGYLGVVLVMLYLCRAAEVRYFIER